jgi:2-dehydropantoate 2-reductase
MKIAIVGCGALGSFYGAVLCRAGHETHFLLRSDYEAVARDGVRVESVVSGECFTARPRTARSVGEVGPADLVVVGLKTTANARLREWIPALVNEGTVVLTLQNGLGNEELLAGIVRPEQVMGGLCFVSLNRTAPGVVRHINGARILMGEFGRRPDDRTHRVAAMWREAGIPCDVAENLGLAHWLKLVWNIAFNGLGVASAAGYDSVLRGGVDPESTLMPCLTTDQLLASPAWRKLVQEVMLEVIDGATRLGFAIDPGYARAEMERTGSMGVYRASTLVDFERGSPLELESLFLEPLRQARRAGAALPRIEAMCRVLQELDAIRARHG